MLKIYDKIINKEYLMAYLIKCIIIKKQNYKYRKKINKRNKENDRDK